MLKAGEKLPRLVIIDEEPEDDDGGDILKAKDEKPPVGIVDPELRKMWHNFRAINKSRPDRNLELPRNLSDEDVAIMLNALARGQDTAGTQLALVMNKFFPLKDDTDQTDSSNQQQDAKPTEAAVKDEIEKPSRGRSEKSKILAHSSQVKESRKKGRPSNSVLVSHQPPKCKRLGDIALKEGKEKVATKPREIPKERRKRAKSEVLPLMNKRLSTPRERTTSYKMKLNPVWTPFSLSLLDPPSSKTDEVVQITQAFDSDRDLVEEQAISANGEQMEPSLAFQPHSQSFGMMPKLICYHGGVPHPFCGPLPNFMAPFPMQLQTDQNQTTQSSNYAYNFCEPQASPLTVNQWIQNAWNSQFRPPFY